MTADMPSSPRVTSSGNTAKTSTDWLMRAVSQPLPANLAPSSAMFTLANMFRFLADADKRGDRALVVTLRQSIVALSKTYSLRQIAESERQSAIVALIDDTKRRTVEAHVRLGRKPAEFNQSDLDKIATALFMLNPTARPLKDLYSAIYPMGKSRYSPDQHRVMALGSVSVMRSRRQVNDYLLRNEEGTDRAPSGRRQGGFAVHLHPDTGQQYFQLASFKPDADPMYTFRAQAWAMREYARVLKDYDRIACPFMAGTLENTPMGEPTVSALLRGNTGGLDDYDNPRYLELCYRKLLEYNPSPANRSQAAFQLPYFIKDQQGRWVMCQQHLHLPHARLDTARGAMYRQPRIMDAYIALSSAAFDAGYRSVEYLGQTLALPAMAAVIPFAREMDLLGVQIVPKEED